MTDQFPVASPAPFRIARVVAIPALGAASGDGPAESVSVGLLFEGGTLPVAWGDCVAAPGPAFDAAAGLATIERFVAPALQGRAFGRFRDAAAWMETLAETVEEERLVPVADPSRRALFASPLRALRGGQDAQGPTERVSVERPLHPAVRFGVSQALLQAVAWQRGLTMAEALASEWDLAPPQLPVPLLADLGPDFETGAARAIARRLPYFSLDLPGGTRGAAPSARIASQLAQLLRWLGDNVRELGDDEYRPTLHLDLNGALGLLCEHEPGKILGHLYGWEAVARPCRLQIQDPVVLDGCDEQIQAMRTLQDYMRARKMSAQLVAGECAVTLDDIRAFVEAGAAGMVRIDLRALGGLHNTVDAVQACKAGGAGTLLDAGYVDSCIATRAAVHVALASGADVLVLRQGMNGDAASLAQAEMARALCELALGR